MTNLWSENEPARFWRCRPEIAQAEWELAAIQAGPVLRLSHTWVDIDALLELILGEGQFGKDHWKLSRARRSYYWLKPLIPRGLARVLRRAHKPVAEAASLLNWPIEKRYAQFQWELMRQLLLLHGWQSASFIHFWPQGRQFAFVLTHDVETSKGLSHVRAVADLEEKYGFRSSFNFVTERYPINWDLVDELRRRGFEIGVHGLYHDGRLFSTRKEFDARVRRINQHLKAFGAVGFRSPLTMRQPEWMQALDLEYDLSFFDTDPYEPIPGGTMSIWPFTVGRFVELPYTLVQDYTLVNVLGHTTPQIWFEKVDFIKTYSGMVLLNTHPDFLQDSTTWNVYSEFLQGMSRLDSAWHALPKEVARWWKRRQAARMDEVALHQAGDCLMMRQMVLIEDRIQLC